MTLEKSRNRDIQNLLSVLGAAVICAGLLALVFLYYYGSSGRYLAGNTLLDPAIMEQINAQDQHSRTKKKIHFAFDRIEFFYFDPQKGQMRTHAISVETYQNFYKMVAAEKSLEDEVRDIQDFFVNSHPSVLTINMRTIGKSENSTNQIFQIVQFVQENYFRVQLHEKKEGEWAYFYRPGLYQDIMQLFTQS